MLHIINKSSLAASALDDCLRCAGKGSLLLIEDGVYAATLGHAGNARIAEALARLKVYALQPDLEARGVADRLVAGVSPVGYDGFVALVAEHSACHSWL